MVDMKKVYNNLIINLLFAHPKGPNQIKHNLNQTYDYWSGKHKWQLDRIFQDALFPEARIFTDTIQDTRIKLDENLGVAILWKDYCSECSTVFGYGPQCLEVTFKGQDGNIDHLGGFQLLDLIIRVLKSHMTC